MSRVKAYGAFLVLSAVGFLVGVAIVNVVWKGSPEHADLERAKSTCDELIEMASDPQRSRGFPAQREATLQMLQDKRKELDTFFFTDQKTQWLENHVGIGIALLAVLPIVFGVIGFVVAWRLGQNQTAAHSYGDEPWRNVS